MLQIDTLPQHCASRCAWKLKIVLKRHTEQLSYSCSQNKWTNEPDQDLDRQGPPMNEQQCYKKCFCCLTFLDGGNLTMANIEDEEEDVVVVEMEPPKRKKIATLKVWGHRLQSRLQSRVLCFLIRQTVFQTRLLDSVCSDHNSPDSLNHDVDWRMSGGRTDMM